MNYETLEKLVSSYMKTNQSCYTFGWQGGEPTLMGTEFYSSVVAFQKKYGKQGDVVSNSVQTNATLIDDEMAALFAEYKFLLGASLDGPEKIHNTYRRYRGVNPSHSDVLKGISILRKHNVEFNILTLVSKANSGKASEIYSYLTDNEFLHHQYIPCVENNEHGVPLPFSISDEEWGQFMCDIFDIWKITDTRKVSVRLFDCVLSALVNNSPGICHFQSSCDSYFVVEYNGDVYPCDFFVTEKHTLGNIHDNDWKSLCNSNQYREFANLKSKWHPDCTKCEWNWICRGECLKHRIVNSELESRSKGALCAGWKMFFNHTMDSFKVLANEIVNERKAKTKQLISIGHANPQRNELCLCGSGKKFKNCCL